MIKAILIDLDNTLLGNDDHVFALEYLRLAETFFAARWGVEGFSQVILRYIRGVTHLRDDVRISNTEYAIRLIGDAAGIEADEVRAGFEAFYREAYPVLQDCTQPVTGARALLDCLWDLGYSIVIATNPIYPAEAIRQRLAWAGLPDDLNTYTFVTHGDTMRFAKPNPAYYAEILARVKIEPDEAVMIGDSLDNDIVPAEIVGIHTYHMDGENTLETIMELVKGQNWLENLFPKPLKPEMIEPQYTGNLGAMCGMLDDVKPHFWHQQPDPNEWSIMQILCHLAESEVTVQRPRLKQILSAANPFLADPKPPPGPNARPCSDDGWQVADQFTKERRSTLQFIQSLRDEDWLRPARHSIFGPTTLLEMAHFTAQHDRLHLRQLCQTIGSCE